MKLKIWIKLMKMGAKLGCHQMPERSFFYKGYQFPVCARCTGLMAGYLLGIFVYFLKIINWKLKGKKEKGIWEKETMLKFFQVNRDIFLRTFAWWRLLCSYFSRSFAGRNHFGCQHAADAALHFCSRM